MKVDNVDKAEKHLPVPLRINEKVIVIDEMTGTQFIKVRHNSGKNVSVFSRNNFVEVSKADRKVDI